MERSSARPKPIPKTVASERDFVDPDTFSPDFDPKTSNWSWSDSVDVTPKGQTEQAVETLSPQQSRKRGLLLLSVVAAATITALFVFDRPEVQKSPDEIHAAQRPITPKIAKPPPTVPAPAQEPSTKTKPTSKPTTKSVSIKRPGTKVEKKRSYADWIVRGKSLRKRGRVEEAVQAFGEASLANPGAAEPLVLMGWLQMELSAKREALQAFEEAISRSGRNASAYFGKAEAHYSLGERAQALSAYNKFLTRAAANNPNRRIALIRTRSLKDKPQKATPRPKAFKRPALKAPLAAPKKVEPKVEEPIDENEMDQAIEDALEDVATADL